jgi:hypothetical protein
VRTYRVMVSAYNSRRDFPSRVFEYDIRAIDRDQLMQRIPRTHRGPDSERYRDPHFRPAMPYFGAWRTTPAYYPEWSIEEIKLIRQPKRGPRVWLSKGPVMLRGCWTAEELAKEENA